jgi:hypothetical protein
MDPLKSGAIFKLKNLNVMRSPSLYNNTRINSANTHSQINISPAPAPSPSSGMVRTDPSIDIIRKKFEEVYRATPIPKGIMEDGILRYLNLYFSNR